MNFIDVNKDQYNTAQSTNTHTFVSVYLNLLSEMDVQSISESTDPCICMIKQYCGAPIEHIEFHCGDLHIMVFFGAEDQILDNYCISIFNVLTRGCIHTHSDTFYHMIKWLRCLHIMMGDASLDLQKLKIVGEFERETRNISIQLDSYEAVYRVRCNGSEIIIDELCIEELVKLESQIREDLANYRAVPMDVSD